MPTGDRVQLVIELSGYQNAYNSLANLRRAVDQIKSSKITLQFEAAQIRREIENVRRQIDRLNDIRVGQGLTEDMERELEGLEKGLHANRHSFATILLKDAESKGQIKEVSELLGHAQVSTTYDYYIHTFNEEKRTLGRSLDTLEKIE